MSREPDAGVHATAVVEGLNNRLGARAAYITLGLGYLFGILQANYLTVLNFLLFTLLQLCFCAVLWWLIKGQLSRWQLVLNLTLLTVITVGSGWLSAIGIQFDWLMYLVVLALFFMILSARIATMLGALLFLAMAFNLAYITNFNWHGASSALLQLLPAYCFVALFSLVMRILERQKDRAEQLLAQLEQSNAELERAHKQLQAYANEVEELTIVRERTRLAREMHDVLGHYLSILNIQLETISKLQERDPARAAIEIAEARQVATQAIQEVRNAVAALRPTSIATLNLAEALAQLAREFERVSAGASVTLDLDAHLPSFAPDVQVAFYRVAQEALTNVRKHTQATKVLLRLRYEDDVLELLVLDNGTGVANGRVEEPASGFGLVGLRERVELLGGDIEHGLAETGGYRVLAHVPAPASIAAESGSGAFMIKEGQ